MTTGSPEREVVPVPPEMAGERLDRALVQLFPPLTRSLGQKLIRSGAVKVDGVVGRASDRVAPGQLLTVGAPPQAPDEQGPEAETIPLDIIYEDDHLLVVNKPPTMVVHPSKGHDGGTLVNALLGYCRLSSAGEAFRPGLVHRLDQHTSGLLMVAKTNQAHDQLSRQIEQNSARRIYEALCWGAPRPPQGVVQAALGRHPTHRTMQAVLPADKGREAVTHYTLREAYRWSWSASDGGRPSQREAAWVECELHTGRTHQIRVHLAHAGHPLIGDSLYGDRVRDEQVPGELQTLIRELPGQALHSSRLEFTHPASGQRLTVTAPPPEGFRRIHQWLQQATGGGEGELLCSMT